MLGKKRMLWFALATLVGALLLVQGLGLDAATATATASGKPYSVSLNSPAAFPVDI